MQNAHFIPLDDDVFHVLVRCEKTNDSIRHSLTEFHYQISIVSEIANIFSFIEFGRDLQLVNSFSHNQRRNGITWKHNVEGFQNFRLEIQDLRIYFDWRYSTRSQYYIPEFLKDRFSCYRGIQAVELHEWVVNQVVLWVWLDYH